MQSIEERVARLEQVVFNLNRTVEKDAWKKTLGMFDDDPMMKEIIDEALRIREEERRLARNEFESGSAE